MKTAPLTIVPIVIALIVGPSIILTVGLLCGLVARPNNCIDRPTSASTQPSVQTTAQVSTNTISGLSITTRETTGRTLPALTSGVTQPPRTTQPPSDFRLPKDLAPLKYVLTLRVDFDPFANTVVPDTVQTLAYTGEVTISVRAAQSTDKIVLHMDKGLEPTDPNIVVLDENTEQAVQVLSSEYADNQLFKIQLASFLEANKNYSVLLKFKGATTRGGFVYHGFEESFQRSRSILATNFFPDKARTAFPCFDEPGFKASFDITIEHPNRSIALSNFPSSGTENFVDNGTPKLRTRFQTTYVMSTYLVSWAVVPNDFGVKKLENIPELNDLTISVYGRASEINAGLGDFALEVAQKTLTYLNSNLKISDALPPKIDLIAIPFFPVFSSASWGLNGFREDDLFYNASYNSKQDRQFTALEIAKEMARNWFGNYITVTFWDDLWIQEGLATLFQYRAIENIYTEFDIQNQFLIQFTVPGMWDDSYLVSRPLKFNITSKSDIVYLFETQSFTKSAAFMRMFAGALGDTVFSNGIDTFLSSHPNGVITAEYFYFNFPAPSTWPISTRDYINPWVTRSNFPKVGIFPTYNNGNYEIKFNQSRFYISPWDGSLLEPGSADDYIWPIYLECRAGGIDVNNPLAGDETRFAFMLTTREETRTLDRNYGWVKCNQNFNGFYVTEYDDTVFNEFETIIYQDHERFSPAERLNLIHVAYELAYYGTKSYTVPNTYSKFLEDTEDNYAVWKTWLFHMERLSLIMGRRDTFRNLRSFAIRVIEKKIERSSLDIWVESADHTEELLKIDFAEALCLYQHKESLDKVTELFNTISPVYFISPFGPNTNPLQTNIRPIVYKYHLQNTNNFFDWFDVYDFTAVNSHVRENEYAIEALGYTRHFWIYDFISSEILHPVGTTPRIKIEDAFRLLSSMGKNPTGRYFTFSYLKNNWAEFNNRGVDMRQLGETLYTVTSSFETFVLLQEVLSWANGNPDAVSLDLDILDRILDTIGNNYEWVQRREMDFLVVDNFGKDMQNVIA